MNAHCDGGRGGVRRKTEIFINTYRENFEKEVKNLLTKCKHLSFCLYIFDCAAQSLFVSWLYVQKSPLTLVTHPTPHAEAFTAFVVVGRVEAQKWELMEEKS